MYERKECIRCGACCITVPCNADTLDENGICSYLTIYKEGYTSCKSIEERGNPFSGGCMLRRSKEIYEYYKNQAEEKVGIKLVGIKIAEGVT